LFVYGIHLPSLSRYVSRAVFVRDVNIDMLRECLAACASAAITVG
jgi:hypothetical protein